MGNMDLVKNVIRNMVTIIMILEENVIRTVLGCGVIRMKVEARIAKVVLWEKRKDYGGIERIVKADGEYDFLVIGIPNNEPWKVKLLNSLKMKDFLISVEQTMIWNGMWMPVKRPHNYKAGDMIEVSFETKPLEIAT